MTNERQGIEALAGTTGKAKKVSEKRKEMAKVVTEAQRGKILVLFVFAVSDGAWLYWYGSRPKQRRLYKLQDYLTFGHIFDDLTL